MELNVKMDWKLLRAQKRLLVSMHAGNTITAAQEDAVEGIINLLDAIQDQAVEQGVATEREVFGKVTEGK